MNFSRRGVTAKQKNIKSSARRLSSKLGVTAFRLAIVLIVSASIIGGVAGYGALTAIIDIAPDIDMINVAPSEFASYTYYSDGTMAQPLVYGEANRDYVTIDQIPKIVQQCFIALEDERFYEHDGIDIRGIFRAGVSMLSSKDLGFGASTLTQQLLKNYVFEGGNEAKAYDKIIRKIQEQYLAIQLEDRLEKDQILEYYLNFVNLGNGAYGIQTAAKTYFGKDVSELTLSEASVLAPIPLSPTNQNPIKYPEVNAERRTKCLENMRDLDFITEEQFQEALADDIYSRIKAIATDKNSNISYYSYFTDAMLDQVTQDLQDKLGYTPEQARDKIFKGGISIFTTQDRKIQSIVDKYYTDETYFPVFGFSKTQGSCYELSYAVSVLKPDGTETHYQMNDFLEYFKDYNDTEQLYYHKDGGTKGISELGLDPGDMNAKIDEFVAAVSTKEDRVTESKSIVPQPQSSFTVLEQSTGKVAAVYGGRGKKVGSRTLNRATGTLRQVGSTFKVLASFLPALDAGGLTLASVFNDSRYFYPGGKEVINHYSGFRGLQPIRSGISSSLNIVAVKTLEHIGSSLGFEYLEKLNFSSLVKSRTGADGKTYSDINLSIALGGLTDGVTNLEVTAAYAAIANQGTYIKPRFYTKILDQDGKILLSNEEETSQVMKESTSWLLTSAMQDTVTRGTGTRLAFENYDMPVAGKTGTSTKNNDLWFCGYTPYYTASVWTGYDNNFEQRNTSYQQYIWRGIMEEIHEKKKLPAVTFEMPDSITATTVCTKCGNLAISGLCDVAAGGPYTKYEYFAKGTTPGSQCNCHVKATICKTSSQLAGEFCPPADRTSSVFLLKDENSDCTTWDTPYLMRSGVCKVHTTAYTPPPEEEFDDPLLENNKPKPATPRPTKEPEPSPTEEPTPTKKPITTPSEEPEEDNEEEG